MREPAPPPADPAPVALAVELAEVSPAAVEQLVAAVAPPAPGGPVGLSAAATEKLVDAAVLATPPKPPETPAQEAEQARMTAGQRAISHTWEMVQATLAIIMTGTTAVVASWLLVFGKSPELALASLVFLTTSSSNVLAVYMTRTNHSAVGGVGDKKERTRGG